MSINQLTMFKLWGDFDEDNVLKVIDENAWAKRPDVFKQSIETIPMNRKQRRAAKKQQEG